MATYTDAELESLMSDLESASDFVECKESAADGRKIRRNICAFANDLPGDGRSGVVLVGVRDDGSCAFLPIDDDLLTRLANVRGEGDILPLPSMTVQKRVLNGCEVAVVFVEPSADTPVRYPTNRSRGERSEPRRRAVAGTRPGVARVSPAVSGRVLVVREGPCLCPCPCLSHGT